MMLEGMRDLVPKIISYLGSIDRKNFINAAMCDKRYRRLLPHLSHLIILKKEVPHMINLNAANIENITIFYHSAFCPVDEDRGRDTTTFDLSKFINLRRLVLMGDYIDYNSIIKTCRGEKIESLTIMSNKKIEYNDVSPLIAAFSRLREFYLCGDFVCCEMAAKTLSAISFPYAVLISHKYADPNFIIENGREMLADVYKEENEWRQNLYSKKFEHLFVYHADRRNIDLHLSRDKNNAAIQKYIQHAAESKIITLTPLAEDYSGIIAAFGHGFRRYQTNNNEIFKVPSAFCGTDELHLSSMDKTKIYFIHCDNAAILWPNIRELSLEYVCAVLPIPAMPQLYKLTLAAPRPNADDLYIALSKNPIKHLYFRNIRGYEYRDVLKHFCNIEILEIDFIETMIFDFEDIAAFGNLREIIFLYGVTKPKNLDKLRPNVLLNFSKYDPRHFYKRDTLPILTQRPQFNHLRHFDISIMSKSFMQYNFVHFIGDLMNKD